jgi:hypothetical protein
MGELGKLIVTGVGEAPFDAEMAEQRGDAVQGQLAPDLTNGRAVSSW